MRSAMYLAVFMRVTRYYPSEVFRIIIFSNIFVHRNEFHFKIAQKLITRESLQIGLVYDISVDYHIPDGPSDGFAEFEPESTITAMEQAIIISGHRPVRIGSPRRLLEGKPEVDLIWNIGEGYGTRNREAWAPVLCEMRGIPFIGSDAHTLTVTLDKVLSKQIARYLGIPTTDWQLISRNDSIFRKLPEPELSFPLFLKPRYEGTAKGITPNSIVFDSSDFKKQCRYLLDSYHQDVIAEPFLPGAELTCAMTYHPLEPLPVLERGLHDSGIGSHALNDGNQTESRTSDPLSPDLEKQIFEWSRRFACELSILDFARFDYKMDLHGKPMFLEVNPLPTFGIDSTFAILAEIEDKSYPEYLSGILSASISRLVASES